MLKVKICGITNLEDALHAVACGADALGFVFYEKSPRYITPIDAKAIIEQLPPFVERVGLFVNVDATHINTVCKDVGISLAQLHFEVDEAFMDAINLATLPVVRAQNSEDINNFKDSYRLVDAYSEAYGGTGKRLNLEWFNDIDCSKIILAGGLDIDNVTQVKECGFYGLDVSSGVERSKGKKDPIKVKKFIANAKSL